MASHSSIVGGSSAQRVLRCPGSIDQAAKAPPAGSSGYAQEGTALHSAMEYLAAPGATHAPDDLLGLTFDGVTITEAHITEAIVPALSVFREVTAGKQEYFLELPTEFPGIPGAFGTTDVATFSENYGHLFILDYKFGKGVPVSAENNAQLMFYACGVLTAHDAWRKTKTVTMQICQPRIEDGDSQWTVPIAQLRAFRHSLIRAVNGPRYLESGAHCRWCPAAAFCPKKKEEAKAALAWQAAGSEVAEAMKMIPELKEWINAVESAAYSALEAGAIVEGYKLVDKRATRKWAVDNQKLAEYLSNHGLEEDQFAPRSYVSPAQAEKLLKPLGEKLEGDMVKSESSGYTVAPETDKRPAISTGRDLSALASFIN